MNSNDHRAFSRAARVWPRFCAVTVRILSPRLEQTGTDGRARGRDSDPAPVRVWRADHRRGRPPSPDPCSRREAAPRRLSPSRGTPPPPAAARGSGNGGLGRDAPPRQILPLSLSLPLILPLPLPLILPLSLSLPLILPLSLPLPLIPSQILPLKRAPTSLSTPAPARFTAPAPPPTPKPISPSPWRDWL
jgi:hypothetical protein